MPRSQFSSLLSNFVKPKQEENIFFLKCFPAQRFQKSSASFAKTISLNSSPSYTYIRVVIVWKLFFTSTFLFNLEHLSWCSNSLALNPCIYRKHGIWSIASFFSFSQSVIIDHRNPDCVTQLILQLRRAEGSQEKKPRLILETIFREN